LLNAIGLHNVDLIMPLTLILVTFAATVGSILLFFDHKLHSRA
jgi:NitT/TauT family transport system permease protein